MISVLVWKSYCDEILKTWKVERICYMWCLTTMVQKHYSENHNLNFQLQQFGRLALQVKEWWCSDCSLPSNLQGETSSSLRPSFEWLIDKLIDWLPHWLVDWSINWLTDWLTDLLSSDQSQVKKGDTAKETLDPVWDTMVEFLVADFTQASTIENLEPKTAKHELLDDWRELHPADNIIIRGTQRPQCAARHGKTGRPGQFHGIVHSAVESGISRVTSPYTIDE